MFSKLFDKLCVLDRCRLIQSDKDNHYHEVISIRSRDAKKFDAIGYNQLHWATLCEQSDEEIKGLIYKEDVDVNAGTKPVGNDEFGMSLAGLTPLYIAVHIGSVRLTELLLNNKANKEVERQQVIPLTGPLSGNDYTTVRPDTTVANYALYKKNPTFKIFEKGFIQKHLDKLSQDQEGYNSILPTSVASFFYYSKKEELKSIEKLNKLVSEEPVNMNKLRKLSDKYPAIKQDEERYEIYNASLLSRC